MKIREESLTKGSYVTTLSGVQFINHRRRLLRLTPLWDALWELVNYRIPSVKDSIEQESCTLHDETPFKNTISALYVLATHIGDDVLTENKYIRFHPAFEVLRDEQLKQSLQTLFVPKPTSSIQRERLFNKILNSQDNLDKAFQIITLLQQTLYKSVACYAFERSSRNRRNNIYMFFDSLRKQYDSFYVLRLTLLRSPITRLQLVGKSEETIEYEDDVTKIDTARKALCQELSRRQTISKNKIGYFWTLQHDMDIGMHVNVTLLYPMAEYQHGDAHVDLIEKLMAKHQLSVGIQSPLDRHTAIRGNKTSGNLIRVDEPTHVMAIGKMLEEYYLDSRFIKLNLPRHIKSSGSSLTR